MNHPKPFLTVPDATGCRVREMNTRGRVVSVYKQAVNIGIPQGILVSLVSSPHQMTSLGVCLHPLFDDPRYRRLQMPQVDDMVPIERGRLFLGRMTIDLDKGSCFHGKPDPRLSAGLDRIKKEALRRALCLTGINGGLLGLINQSPATNPIVERCRSLTEDMGFGDDSWVHQLSGMVGLGIGLTPSGDDFICGFLLGRKIFSNAMVDPSQKPLMLWSDTQKTVLEKAALRTSSAGRTLIWMALRGEFPQYLLRAVTEIAHATQPVSIFKAVNKATGFGKTSGTDALVGLYFFLQLYYRTRGKTRVKTIETYKKAG